jgi:hypothetical protein
LTGHALGLDGVSNQKSLDTGRAGHGIASGTGYRLAEAMKSLDTNGAFCGLLHVFLWGKKKVGFFDLMLFF